MHCQSRGAPFVCTNRLLDLVRTGTGMASALCCYRMSLVEVGCLLVETLVLDIVLKLR